MVRFVSALIAFVVVVGLTAIVPAPLTADQESRAARTVYVSVVDNKGVPIPDLTAADFAVKEDGKVRPIESVEVSRKPMRGAAAISITTTGGRNIKAQDFTDSTATLIGVVNRLFARNQSGSYLVEGLAGAAAEFIKMEATRPVILSIGVEGDEQSAMRANDAMAVIQRSTAQVYMVRLGRPVIGQSNPVEALRGESNADEATIANSVFGQAPSRSGGRIEQLSQHTGIPKLVDQIATELLGQYAITYTSANLQAPDLRFQVETSRRGAKVRAPTRVGPPRR
jgi:hypothetical protein